MNVNQVTDYFPKSHARLGLKYVGRLGSNSLAVMRRQRFTQFQNRGLRISLHKSFDMNSVKAYAPRGFAILIESTSFSAEARIDNTALTLEAPVYSMKSPLFDLISYLGLGVIRNRSRSHGIARSDFLNISIIKTRIINRPLFSFVHRVRSLHVDD